MPKSGPGHLDQTSVGIRQALNVPKTNKYVNEQIRGTRDIEGTHPQIFLYKSHFLHKKLSLQSYTQVNVKPLQTDITPAAKHIRPHKSMVITNMDVLMPAPCTSHTP